MKLTLINIVFLLLLTSCQNDKDREDFDRNMKIIKEQTELNRKKISNLDCRVGVFITISQFSQQLKNKISKEQLDMVWNQCSKYAGVKDNED